MLKGFTSRARRIVLVEAQKEARRFNSPELEPEHILISLLLEQDSTAARVLHFLRISLGGFREELEKKARERFSPYEQSDFQQPDAPPSNRCKLFLQNAGEESRILEQKICGTGHFLLAALRDEDSAPQNYLLSQGTDLDMLRILIKTTFNRETIDAGGENSTATSFENMFVPFFPGAQDMQSLKKRRSFLDVFTKDLSALAYNGKLDPVIGREKEIERAVRVLARRTKNNPVLVGEPGVGKTAIAEGLAQFLTSRAAPESLYKKRVLSLNLGQLVAGTKYRGEFEERINKLTAELCADGNIILFIDEIHTLIGAGSASGSLDASNMLKPALARGTGGFQCIGATTLAEYKKYFEKDGALERRFQKILVEEPNAESVVNILNGLKKSYEDYHNVNYTDEALREAVRLSRRFIHGRQLPDKAIDILDETGAAKKLELERVQPAELTHIEEEVDKLVKAKDDILHQRGSINPFELFIRMKELRKDLETARTSWERILSKKRPSVTAHDVAAAVAEMTDLPLVSLEKSEAGRLLALEEELEKSVIGQVAAISALCASLRRAGTGLSPERRPIGSFLFVGPAGVGKSYLAKSLARALFGSEEALLRVDMSDYMEKHNAARLAGAPPGYAGFEEGGILTESVRQRPYRVILFDEIEKAHRSVLNLLLQVLEEGELQDNLGHKVDFSNTVIIMTSNAGSEKFSNGGKLGFSASSLDGLDYEELKTDMLAECKKAFSAEFLSRIDETVVFAPLSEESLRAIMKRGIDELRKNLERRGRQLAIDDKALNFLLGQIAEEKKGARSLKRILRREMEEPLAVYILENEEFGNEALIAELDEKSGSIKIKLDLANVDFLGSERGDTYAIYK